MLSLHSVPLIGIDLPDLAAAMQNAEKEPARLGAFIRRELSGQQGGFTSLEKVTTEKIWLSALP